jgi:hypothetical protein
MRWGMRPRWNGSHDSMLALGVTAINTGRFDTDVPRKFMDVVNDMESELESGYGEHIYGRDDIWPQLKRMYEGYIAETSRANSRDGWRGTYAAVAYLAGKYDVARTQLAALEWQPWEGTFNNWGVDLSLMPLEVAARTGALSNQIADAESAYASKETTNALRLFSELARDSSADKRTMEFIRHRIAALKLEDQLQRGEWMDFLPANDSDPNWLALRGKFHRLPDGALEVRSGHDGHLIYCRARVGEHFEVKGEFEVAHSSNPDFQAGLVLGLPDLSNTDWFAHRVKRNETEGDVSSFSAGWTSRQMRQNVKLNDGTNSFRLRFQNEKVTTTVNGFELLSRAKPPQSVRVPDDEFLIGLGAFNDMNDTVIRYRNVQVRQLTAKSKQE